MIRWVAYDVRPGNMSYTKKSTRDKKKIHKTPTKGYITLVVVMNEHEAKI